MPRINMPLINMPRFNMSHVVLTRLAAALLASAAFGGTAVASDAPQPCGAQNGLFNWSDTPARACRDRAAQAAPTATQEAQVDSTLHLATKTTSDSTASPGTRSEFTFSGYAYFGIAATFK